MVFFSKLLGKDDWKKTLIRDLTMLTAVDGDMDKDEVAFVMKIAVEDLGFSKQNFVDLLQNLGDIKDIYPENHEDKLEFLEYLLKMTYVDGYVDDNEVEYMKIIAQRMNLPANAIDKAIAYIESSSESSTYHADENDDDLSDDSERMKIVITSPFDPTPEVQLEDGVHKYFLKLSKLTRSDLCTELSNVMAAKHNLMLMPSPITEARQKQEKVTDLTDKAVLICIHEFGQEIVMDYGRGDIRKFNELVNAIDEDVAQQDLNSDEHGCRILRKLSQVLTK